MNVIICKCLQAFKKGGVGWGGEILERYSNFGVKKVATDPHF